ncbi:MAG: hypothetical protein MUD16_10705 [Desulfobacterales bacterium]|jgi:hypothetical protein|nr:hypothetical protein [Desulfobacterales bacterium]
MPEISALDPDGERQVRLMRRFQHKKRHYLLRAHISRAALQITEAIVPKLRDDNPDELRTKSRLLKRSSGACDRLANYPGALRFCEFRVQKAAQWLKRRGVL